MMVFRVRFLLAIAIASAVYAPAGQVSRSCHVTEQSIFADCATGPHVHSGTMRSEDLSVEGFRIGMATLDRVEARFPGTKKFRLTKEEESPIGVCVANRRGYAVVFASGYAGGWKFLDSIYIAPVKSLEKQGAKCLVTSSLPAKLSTDSGIHPGIGPERLRALLRDAEIMDSHFEIDYSTSPDKAPWVSKELMPTQGEGWKAISGAIGGFRGGKLRWLVLYGAVSD